MVLNADFSANSCYHEHWMKPLEGGTNSAQRKTTVGLFLCPTIATYSIFCLKRESIYFSITQHISAVYSEPMTIIMLSHALHLILYY